MPRENRKRGKKHKKQPEEDKYLHNARIHEPIPEPEVLPEEPSWILPTSKQEEDQNPESPFGYVDVDVKAYFRTVDVQIRDWQENQEVAEGDVDPNEQKRLFFMAALNEMHGKEKQLATDPDCSVILERMSYSMDDFVRRVFVDSLAGSYGVLVRHRFASHVCQTLFTVARDTIIRETKGIMPSISESTEQGELRTLTQLVLDISEEILPKFASLINDPFGSHVVRSLLLLLSPSLASSSDTQSTIRSKKSATWKARQGHMKSVFDQENGKDSNTISKSSPPEFRRMAKRFVEAIRSELGENEVRAMAASKVACPGLKILLEVEADQEICNESGSLMDRVMVGIITACQNGAFPAIEESDYLGTLIRDPNSSHLLETIVSRCPDDAFDVLWKIYFKGKLPRLAAHPVANFVLAKAIERVSEIHLTAAVEELNTIWNKLIRTSKTGVIRAIIDRAAVLKSSERSISKIVFSAFDISNAEDEKLIVPCVLTLLPLPEYTAALTNHGRDEPHSLHHNTGKNKTNDNPLEPKTQGSILLQSILRLPEPLNQFVTDSIHSLSVEERIKIAHNSSGSRVYDALLESPTVAPKFKRQFVMDFIGYYHILVDDKLGSRVGDRCWAFSDTYLKEKIARSLVSKEQDLAASFYGKFFARNLNLYLLQRRPDEWRNLQSDRRRAQERDLQQDEPTSTPARPEFTEQSPAKLKRKNRPEDEIDELFNQTLGRKTTKASLEDNSSVPILHVSLKDGQDSMNDRELEKVLDAIRIAPKTEVHPKKKKKTH